MQMANSLVLQQSIAIHFKFQLKKKKKESATTLVCDYKNVIVQTSSSSVSLQYRKREKAFSFVLFKLINLTKYFQNIYNNNYQSS